MTIGSVREKYSLYKILPIDLNAGLQGNVAEIDTNALLKHSNYCAYITSISAQLRHMYLRIGSHLNQLDCVTLQNKHINVYSINSNSKNQTKAWLEVS